MNSLEMSVEPSKKGGNIEIDLASCIHVGHVCHERELTEKFFQEIYDTPDRYMISVGDNQDNGTKNSPGASWAEQTHNPREQLILTAALYGPLVKKGKVLWMQDSNHSNRIFKETGFVTSEEALWRLLTGRGVTSADWDIIERYFRGRIKGRAQEETQDWIQGVLDGMKDPAPDKLPLWGGWQTIVKLHVGKAEYMIHSMHGEGTGVAASSALQAVMKQTDIAEGIDLYFRGHHHKRVLADKCFAGWSGKNKLASFRRVGFVATGCMLGYHNSYGEAKGYAPLANGMARITLSSTSKTFTLSM